MKARHSAASGSARLLRPFGQRLDKISEAKAGEIVALAKVDVLSAGQSLAAAGIAPTADFPRRRAAGVRALARRQEPQRRGQAVGRPAQDRRGGSVALLRGARRDPRAPDQGPGRDASQGRGRQAGRPLQRRGRDTTPRVAYRETIQAGTQQHARYKRQTGRPRPVRRHQGRDQAAAARLGLPLRRQDRGRRRAAQLHPRRRGGPARLPKEGPLGQPVVDLEVTLFDGQFHAVDSSEMSFKMAARIAMSEAMPKCRPVLLEPILKVTVAAPSESTPRIQRLISGRRGQLLGYDTRAGWNGWDEVSALMPEAEIADMIVEIRSVTQGVGTFRTEFDHLQELAGRTAERIVEETKKRAAA